MKTMNPNVRRWIAVAALVVIALLSVFVLAGRLSDPTFHAASIAALDEKKVTVTELTAAVAAGSVIISAVPGDATTPIANQVAEMATYLLILLCRSKKIDGYARLRGSRRFRLWSVAPASFV